MQKKLIAVAVGSALSAFGAVPALAQNATVNIYGTFYGEYSRINNGAASATEPYQNYDHFQNPGSRIGLRGEEKLGGGLSVWFQCESSIDYRGNNNKPDDNAVANNHWCSRDSALGLKGRFGNVFYGQWGTPWKNVNSRGNVGANDTGVFGTAHLIAGSSSTFGISAPNGPGVSTTNRVSPGIFRRRQSNLFSYETPSFAGFKVMGAVTTRNHASRATSAQLKTRLWSVGAQYANGPIYVGAAYEKHNDFWNLGTAAAPIGGDDKGWTVAASYTLPIRLKIGGSIQQMKEEQALGRETKITTYHIGIDWMISGPHGVRAAYTRAGDVKGPSGQAHNARPAANPDSKADMWQIRYVYALSKRTEFTAGYSRTNNRANATYETGGSDSTQFRGSDSSAFAIAIRHSF